MLLHYTGLTRRQLKHSLAVLIQQQLALWYSSPDNNDTHYEANWTTAYALVRSGKFVKVVEDRYGSFAGGVVSNLLLLGHALAADLAQTYNVSHHSENSVLRSESSKTTNGHLTDGSSMIHDDSHYASSESLDSTVRALHDAGLLSTVHESHFRSETDNRNEAEAVVRSSEYFQGELKGEKKTEFLEAIEKKLLGWRFGTNSGIVVVSAKFNEKALNSKKRKWEEDSVTVNGIGKRRKSDYSQNHENVQDLTPSFHGESHSKTTNEHPGTLRVNHEKFMVVIRSERLVDLVEQRISRTASRVYREVLRQLEMQLKCCNLHPEINDESYDIDIEDNPEIYTIDIGAAMLELESLEGGIGVADPSMVKLNAIIHPKRRRRRQTIDEADGNDNSSTSDEDDTEDELQNGNMSGVEESQNEVNGDADHRSNVRIGEDSEGHLKPSTCTLSTSTPQTSFSLTRQNLFLLAEHPYQFVTYNRRRHHKPEGWVVDFRALTRQMRLIELENIIVSRFGPEALRIVRILQEKGKLEEKAIAQFALMNQKTLRSFLTTMHEAGHLEVQELPRDNHRTPARTMFLWFFDSERCRQKTLEETYKSMSRCLQRARAEREAIRGIIDKASRTDVIGKEDQFLSVDERTALKAWREKEEKLLGEVARLDDLVAVLRDF
ncbi:RNA polymerase III subunit C82 [Lambiella insularis]|nr:RNA polymerase III subunit C82 [Lambiella insularis]